MGNEIYKNQNSQHHSDETKNRIEDFIKFISINLNVPYGSVAEIGCGNKFIGNHFNDKGISFYDYYPNYEDVHFIDLQMSGNHLITDKVSAVIISHTLEHMKNIRLALKILRDEVLSPSGSLYIAVPNAEFPDSNFKPYSEEIGHYSFFSPSILKAELTAVGFKPEIIVEFNKYSGFEEIWCKARREA